MLPRFRGGDESPWDCENLALSCRACNRAKKGKTPLEFLAWTQIREAKERDLGEEMRARMERKAKEPAVSVAVFRAWRDPKG